MAAAIKAAQPAIILAPPVRIKHTVPPPDICTACWWEMKYKRLLEQHKKLRSEMLRGSTPKPRGRPPVARTEEREWEPRDEETLDLVEKFANIND